MYQTQEYKMNYKRELSESDQTLIDEWLKKNKVTQCEEFAKTDPNEIEYTFKVGSRGKPKK